MSRSAVSGRARMAGLALGLVGLLTCSVVMAAPVGFPNPRPGAAIELSGSPLGRIFTFADPAVADGGNPAGVEYTIQITEAGDLDPLGTDDLQSFTATKSTDGAESFTWDASTAQITVTTASGTESYTGLRRNRTYIWRVDVDGVPGTEWTFTTPIYNPLDGSERVSVYVRLVWDANPDAPAGTVQEKLLLVDADEGSPDYDKSWVAVDQQGQVTGINTARVVKTYDPTADAGRAWVREFSSLDEGWVRLLPNRNYRWRIVYCDENGGPLGGNPYAWADGGGDFDPGWSFKTVPEISYQSSSVTECVVIHWESPFGTNARDPAEKDYTFAGVANALKNIHENVHHPSVETIVLGTEEIAASYGGLHNDYAQRAQCTEQAPLVPEITQFPGWYTLGSRSARANAGFPPTQVYTFGPQDRYEEYVARGIRTFLQDAANEDDFGGGNDDHVWLDNLQYVVLLGDGDRVAPSFYYYYTPFTSTNHRWLETDFFYSTQDATSDVGLTPQYQVSRIPIRRKYYETVNPDGDSVDSQGNPYAVDDQGLPADADLREWRLPSILKIHDYAQLLSSESKKNLAYQNWFGRAVVACGSTEYDKWYQFFSGFAQYLLSRRIPIGGGLERDAFSGIKVRRYDIYSTGNERLTPGNVLKHMRDPSDPADVPGFVYLLARGEDTYGDHDAGDVGDNVELSPVSTLGSADFEEKFPDDPTDGRRPLLVSPAAVITNFDQAVWGWSSQSLAEAAMLAQGGPIGVVGFGSGAYEINLTITRNYPDGSSAGYTYLDSVDEDTKHGFTHTTLDRGILKLEHEGDPDAAALGKVEFIRLFAEAYASTTQAGIGNIFNKALSQYVSANLSELTANNQRVTTTVFGANLIGDAALVMPMRQPAVKDNARPAVTDTNPRPATPVTGYDPMPQYNDQDMPVHVIAHTDPYDPDVGAQVTLNIQTDAPYVRVRVLTPFRMNSSYTPGYWYDTSGTYWSSSDPAILQTVDSACTYTFTAKAPSIYIVVVQAQNPAWVEGADDPEWRWLQERWIYIQAVNEFVRDPDSNILVVDNDQADRYYLHGDSDTHVEGYYVNPALDAEGYEVGVDDPRDWFPANGYAGLHKPALPLLNKELGEDIGADPPYKYHYWCSNVYRVYPSTSEQNNYAPNDEAIKVGQRFYGDITPEALKSFQDSRGVVLWFGGDWEYAFPQGYLFWYDESPYKDVVFLENYLDNGGRLWVTDQNVADEGNLGPGYNPYAPHVAAFLETYLGATTQTEDTDYTNMDGLQSGTLSEFIQDVNIAGGDGQNNATQTAELDPNGIEATTVFTWDTTSGPGTVVSSGSSAVHNRLVAQGGRTVFFPWPFEAIDHIGNLDVDNSGRENVLRQVVDWLRSVPKPSPTNPLDGASGVSRTVVLQWTRVPEASFYRVYIGTDPTDLTGPGAVVVRDSPWYDPFNPSDPSNPLLDPSTRYYWRVDCLNYDYTTVTTGDIWSFTTIKPPPKASVPEPEHMQEQVPLDQVFSWINTGTVSTYDMYMWTEDDGDETLDPGAGSAFHVGVDLTEPTFTPSALLTPKKWYYWRVDSSNELSPAPDPNDPNDPGMGIGPTKGDVWQFRTITEPPKPTNPIPPDNAVSVPTTQLMSWLATERTDSYDVFIWKDGEPAPAADDTAVATGTTDVAQYDPGNLATSTLYHWQVRPKNAAGRQNTVDTWSFTTSAYRSPDRVTGMIPEDGATGVPLDVTLMWDPANGAATYNIWLGVGGLPSSPTATGLTETQYKPPTDLEPGSTYYWRVDSVAADGLTTTEGIVQTFTTMSPGQALNPNPADGATGVPVTVVLSWTGLSADSYNIYLGADALPDTPTATGLTESSYDPPGDLEYETTYHWRVDSIFGTTVITGAEWTFTTVAEGEAPGEGGGGGAGACFIATSAYEAANRTTDGILEANCTGRYPISADNLRRLNDIRMLRDRVLNRLRPGRAFSAWYYAIGPYAAQTIRHNEPAKAAVRAVLLDPLSRLSRSCLDPPR